MNLEELKYGFDQIYNIYLNECVLKAQIYEENIMLEYLKLMIKALEEREVK